MILEILAIALGLAMDASAVSLANGLSIGKTTLKQALYIAGSFGIFQGVMPLIGFGVGLTFKDSIQTFDHWIAAGLLALIAIHMIKEAYGEIEVSTKNCLDFRTLMIMSLATSIDALAAGIGFSLLGFNIYFVVSIIAVVTFILSFAALKLGKYLGSLFGKKLEIAGGIILLLIAIKIVFEHLTKGI